MCEKSSLVSLLTLDPICGRAARILRTVALLCLICTGRPGAARSKDLILDLIFPPPRPKKALSVNEVKWDSPELCNDMSDAVCAKGNVDDGTGYIRTDVPKDDHTRQLRDRAGQRLRDYFVGRLVDAPNSNFEKLARKAFQAQRFKECSGDHPSVDRCRTLLANRLAHMALKQTMFSPPDETSALDQLKSFVVADPSIDLKAMEELQNSLPFSAALVDLARNSSELGNVNGTFEHLSLHILPEVKQILNRQIDARVRDPEVRTKMIRRINSLELEKGRCREETVSQLAAPNASYRPFRNEIVPCGGYLLSVRSDISMILTMAHEACHSIDPCVLSIDIGANKSPRSFSPAIISSGNQANRVRNQDNPSFPFADVVSCLRGKESIAAARSPQGESTSQEPTANKEKKMGDCKVGDKIYESFADWCGIEVLAEALKARKQLSSQQVRRGVANTFRETCMFPDYADDINEFMDDEGTSHPSTRKRINRLVLAHPTIRHLMGCDAVPAAAKYCPYQKDSPPVLTATEATK